MEDEIFQYEGWKVIRGQWSVQVQAPNEEFCVESSSEGLFVCGSRPSGNPFQPDESVLVTIPWPVLEAILEAWREISTDR